MTVLGIALFIALGVALTVRRSWLPVVLGAAAGLPYSAGLVVGGTGVPLFSVAAAAAGVALLGTRRLGTAHWTANAFVVFLAWAVVMTALGPWMFAGIRVLEPRGGVDGQVVDPGFLHYSISTFAQFAYLVLAACATLFLVRTRGAMTAAAVALTTGTVLTTVRGLTVAAGFDVLGPLVDTLPSVAYADVGGAARLRGVLSEPSELATFSLTTVGFGVVVAMRSSGRARLFWSVVSALAFVNLLQASSGTAVVASAVFIGFGLAVLAVRYVLRGGVGTPWLVIGLLVTAITALLAGDQLLAPVQDVVVDKVGSQSYNARTAADTFSWGVVADTLGFGTGLGGNRPSSFALAVLSTVGIPGTVAFGAFLVGLVVSALRAPATIPAGTALVGLLLAKVVGTPDFSTPILWVLVAACAVPVWTRTREGLDDDTALPGVARPRLGQPGRGGASTTRAVPLPSRSAGPGSGDHAPPVPGAQPPRHRQGVRP